MFEDTKKEPEDILAGVDKGAPPPTLPTEPSPKKAGVKPPEAPKGAPVPSGGPEKPPTGVETKVEKPSAPPPPPAVAEITEPKVFWQKFLIIGGISVILVSGVIGYILVRKPAPKPEESAPPATEQQPPAAEAEAQPTVPEQPPVVPAPPPDTDNDGLTDEEEDVLGTNPANPDTDNDGLSDREEVEIYLTDPLNPDTDDDTYLDGEEVQNGYDPKGKGKLFEVPAPQE
jgi:hypothetical protein